MMENIGLPAKKGGTQFCSIVFVEGIQLDPRSWVLVKLKDGVTMPAVLSSLYYG
jgi:hypothetical protein